MMSIPELYEYSSHVRRRFADKLAEQPWEAVTKNREASFYSMKNILLHMIDNEDWIVNSFVLNSPTEYEEENPDDFQNMKQIFEYLDRVESKTREYLKTAEKNKDDFNRRASFVLSSGESIDLSVEECLFQSFTEQLYHMGELIALLWQDDIKPPPMMWFRNNPRQKMLRNIP
jgi:uncharacterized damage-inducible protein DinB